MVECTSKCARINQDMNCYSVERRRCERQRPTLTNILLYQARIALRMPWWTLTTGFEMVKSIAGLSGDAASIRQQLDETAVSTNLPPGVDVGTKTDEQVC